MKTFTPWATVFFLLLVTNAEAARYPRDSSGDPMQRFDSQMLSSPMLRFPAILGTSYWPFVPYLPAPSMTFANIVFETPEPAPPPPVPKPPASARFWFSHCGVFVGMDVTSTTNLMEEEQKPCQK